MITQETKILRLLKERGDSGAYIWEFQNSTNVGGLGVSQYGRAIHTLRHRDGHNIVNEKPGHFVLIREDPEQIALY